MRSDWVHLADSWRRWKNFPDEEVEVVEQIYSDQQLVVEGDYSDMQGEIYSDLQCS